MKDLTAGKPLKTIACFAIPIFIGNLFQMLYTLTDGNIVGRYLGDAATAAIGATVPLSTLIVGFASGLGGGFALLVARHFGAKNYDKVRQSIASIYSLGFLIVAILTVITLLSLRPILTLMNTSSSLFELSYRYLVIIISLMIFTFLYNITAGILRAVGDSIIPIVFLIVTTILNVGLDYLFLLVFNWGIEAIAIATIISQFISFIGCYIYMHIRYPILRLKRTDFRFDKIEIYELLKYGFTNAIINFVIQIGSVSIQGSVNSLGDTYITTHAAARKIDDIFMSPFGSIATATATFVSQNYGAKQYQRIKKGLFAGFILSFIYCALIMLLVFTCCEQLIFWFTYIKNPTVVENTANYLYFNFAFYPTLAILFILRASLQAYGHKYSPIIGGFIEMGVKIFIVAFIVRHFGYAGIIVSEPIIWCLSIIVMLYVMFKSFKQFERLENKMDVSS